MPRYVCGTCNGKGEYFKLDHFDDDGYSRQDCWDCGGTGQLPTCTKCGNGVHQQDRYGPVCKECRIRQQADEAGKLMFRRDL